MRKSNLQKYYSITNPKIINADPSNLYPCKAYNWMMDQKPGSEF